MDAMEMGEACYFIDDISYTDTNSWEQTRTQMMLLANMFSKKKLSSSDIMKFPWDKEQGEKDTTISDEEVADLKHKAEIISKTIKNGNNSNKINL